MRESARQKKRKDFTKTLSLNRMLDMSILWFQRYIAIALVALTGFIFSLGPMVHAAHAFDLSVGHESHSSLSHAVQLGCDTCADRAEMDCLRHCLEQSDASHSFRLQVGAHENVLTTSPPPVRCFENTLVPRRSEHETRGSPSVILKTQKLE